MSDIKEIATALAAFQKDMPVLRKTGQNFTKGPAATIGDVVTIAKHGAKHDLSYIQKVSRDEFGSYVESIMMHGSGQSLSSGLYPVIPEKNTPSSFGAAVTFARKNSLMALFGIADHNDEDIDWHLDADGNHIVDPPPEEKPEGKGKITQPDSGQDDVGKKQPPSHTSSGEGVGQSETPTPDLHQEQVHALQFEINASKTADQAVEIIKNHVNKCESIETVKAMFNAIKPSRADIIAIFQERKKELEQ